MTRFYSRLVVEKAYEDGDERVIEGFASTADVDRVGDVVEPEGAKYALPLPLLWKHDSYAGEIGLVDRAVATKKGIKFRAHLVKPKPEHPSQWRALLDEAWFKVKEGVVRFVSIGFKPLEHAYLEGGGVHYPKWDWLELSLVTIPANPNATITQIKALLDGRGMPAALVRKGVAITPADVAAISQSSDQGRRKMNIAEQIKTIEDDIKRKTERMTAIQQKASGEARTKEAGEKDEFDRLDDEIKAMEGELADLKKLEARSAQKAAPVAGNGTKQAEQSRQGEPSVLFNNRRAEKGIGFAHAIMCLAVAKATGISAVDLAKEHYSYDERVAALCKGYIMKAAVGGGVTTTSAWAGALANPQDLVSEFIEFMRAGTIAGKLSKIKRVPFNYNISRQTGAGTAAWAGDGLPTPATKPAYNQLTIGRTSLSALAYISKKNLRFAHIDAERAVRDDLVADCRTLMDTDLVDPANAGTANIKPASITNGLTPTAPTGTDGDAATADLTKVLNKLVTANLKLSETSIIMRDDLALGLSTLKNALGQHEFPDLGPSGGTILKIPVITSNSVKPGDIIALHEPSLYFAMDDDVTVDMSGDASIEALDGSLVQDGTAGTGASLVSMFQNRMIAFLAELYANWAVARTNAVSTIVAANYNGVPSV